jgi:hypothetical protein
MDQVLINAVISMGRRNTQPGHSRDSFSFIAEQTCAARRLSLIESTNGLNCADNFQAAQFQENPEPFLILAAGMVGPLLFKG